MEARLLFIGLWTLADREGRLEDRPKQIKMEVFPADNVDCDALIALIEATGMLTRYEVDGKRFLQVTNFVKHQNPHRDEKASTLPDSCGNYAEPDEPPKKHRASTVQAPCKQDANTVPIGLTPDSRILNPDVLIPETPTQTPPSPPDVADDEPPRVVTEAGAVCVVLKSKGIQPVNPGHPDLLALLAKGAEVGAFAGASDVAVRARKPDFAYVLGIVRRQMESSATIAATAMAVVQPVAVTVPGRQGVDPALAKIISDGLINTKGPPPDVRARMAEMTRSGR